MRPNTGKEGSERDEFGNEVSNVNDNFLLIADAFDPKPRWYAHYVKFSKSKREGQLLRYSSADALEFSGT